MSKKFLFVFASMIIILSMVLAACAPSTGGEGEKIVPDENAPIVVWYDAAPQPAVDKWIATHPDQKDLVTFELSDRSVFGTKGAIVQ